MRRQRLFLVSPLVLWAFALAPAFVVWLFPSGYRFSFLPQPDAPGIWALLLPASALVTATVWNAWRAFGDGTSHVAYTKFPLAPGERVTLWFGTSAGGANFTDATFVLRHVREIATGPFGWRHGALTTMEIPASRPHGAPPGPEQQVVVEFDVPARAEGTCLSAALPHYWLLDVAGRTSSGEHTESFLVPIYERPAARRAA